MIHTVKNFTNEIANFIHKNFAVVLVDSTCFSICWIRKFSCNQNIINNLSSLWFHQWQQTDDYSDMQIALNKEGFICFIFVGLQSLENPHEILFQKINTVENLIISAKLDII